MIRLFGLCLFLTSVSFAADDNTPAQPAALEDALWKGVLTIHIKGPMFRQFLTNRLVDDRIPVGYIKEKAEMDLDVTYRLTFLVNALGEYSLLLNENFSGKQEIDWEYRHRFQEEYKVKESDKDVKVHQTVHAVKRVDTNVTFEREASYDRLSFDFGRLELTPSGRMNKKGGLEIKGEINATIIGDGKVVTTEERQPISETDPNRREIATIEKPFVLPISFSASVKHKKKPVNGDLSVHAPINDPFAEIESDDRISRNFNHRIQVSGTWSLEPLFDK